jgi:hypothetical protein
MVADETSRDAGKDRRPETVLIVHGTFSGKCEDEKKEPNKQHDRPKWYEPGHAFCAILDDELD